MFGLSVGKLLFTALVVFAVLYGWKWLGRVQSQRNSQAPRKGRRRSGAGAESSTAATKAEEMVRCSVCGDYVPAERPRNCGRNDCPYPG
jgi:ribosomal protein L32